MNFSPYFSLKTVLPVALSFIMLGTTVGCTVVGPGYDNQPVYRGNDGYKNANYNRVSQELRQNLRRQGYQVMDIRSATYRNDRVLKAYAKKNNEAYEFTYSYPNLRLLNSSKNQWSEAWNDKDHKKGKNKHKNKSKYKNHKR